MIEATWSSSVRSAAFARVPSSSISQISMAIFDSMAAPTKKVCGFRLRLANASRIRFRTVRAVFQGSSAPAGATSPFSSPSAM
jgi:hypothetical protein